MGKLTFILGGARSGKSSYAERLALANGGRVAYIATAQALDVEMAKRIAIHRQNRPAGWQTLEIPTAVGARLRLDPPQAEVILLDCLTLLTANLLTGITADEEQADEATASARMHEEISLLLQAIQESPAEWIVVSNEVGMGLVPPYPLGRVYRDLLGMANQRLAATADQVVFMIAGIPMRLSQV
jgi:adenosylcobinamide kinase/adenosylcobinamide-phosphate guanylyltransferase